MATRRSIQKEELETPGEPKPLQRVPVVKIVPPSRQDLSAQIAEQQAVIRDSEARVLIERGLLDDLIRRFNNTRE